MRIAGSCSTLLPLFAPVVARGAEALEIALVPEQHHVAFMRDNMTYYGGRCVAHCAPWKCCKESFAQCAPCTVVTALCGCGAIAVVALVTGTGAGDLTGAAGAVWHDLTATAKVWRAAHK